MNTINLSVTLFAFPVQQNHLETHFNIRAIGLEDEDEVGVLCTVPDGLFHSIRTNGLGKCINRFSFSYGLNSWENSVLYNQAAACLEQCKFETRLKHNILCHAILFNNCMDVVPLPP